MSAEKFIEPMFWFTYQGTRYSVHLIITERTGFPPVSVTSTVRTLVQGFGIELEQYLDMNPDQIETILGVITAEGKSGAIQREDGELVPLPWTSWAELSTMEDPFGVPGGTLWKIIANYIALCDMQEAELQALREYYADFQTGDYLMHFRNDIDGAFWQCIHANTSIEGAVNTWNNVSEYELERYLTLKTLHGEKLEDDDSEDEE